MVATAEVFFSYLKAKEEDSKRKKMSFITLLLNEIEPITKEIQVKMLE